ncbi:MAG: hypothetical protein GX115_17410 [Ruminiclostridium sp.]|nr:hypothetical protein [Ruminiclostridium sp.]
MLDKMDFQTIKAKTKIVGYYDILTNDNDEVMIAIPFQIPGEPDKPTFYFSGGAHAFLMKNHRNIVMCDFVNPQVRPIILKNTKVLIAEMNQDKDMAGEYEAELVRLEGLDEIGTRLLEEKSDD